APQLCRVAGKMRALQGAHQPGVPDCRADRGRGCVLLRLSFRLRPPGACGRGVLLVRHRARADRQKTGYLPDDITLPLLWIGLLVNLAGTFAPLAEAVIGAVAGYMVLWTVNAIFRAVRGVEGMGYGDFKMTAAVAAFLGWRELFMVILLSSFVGLLFGSAQMFAARRGLDWKFKFHFGPYIAIAGVIALFWGSEIARRFPMLRPLG